VCPALIDRLTSRLYNKVMVIETAPATKEKPLTAEELLEMGDIT
jgi:hypothetical protein